METIRRTGYILSLLLCIVLLSGIAVAQSDDLMPVIMNLPAHGAPYQFVWSDRGDRLIITDAGSESRIYDALTGDFLAALPGECDNPMWVYLTIGMDCTGADGAGTESMSFDEFDPTTGEFVRNNPPLDPSSGSGYQEMRIEKSEPGQYHVLNNETGETVYSFTYEYDAEANPQLAPALSPGNSYLIAFPDILYAYTGSVFDTFDTDSAFPPILPRQFLWNDPEHKLITVGFPNPDTSTLWFLPGASDGDELQWAAELRGGDGVDWNGESGAIAGWDGDEESAFVYDSDGELLYLLSHYAPSPDDPDVFLPPVWSGYNDSLLTYVTHADGSVTAYLWHFK